MSRLTASLLLAWLATTSFAFAEESVRVVLRADLYAQPSASAAVIAVAPPGQVLEVVVREGDWYAVRLPSTRQTAHVYGPLVEALAPAVPPPVPAPAVAAPPVEAPPPAVPSLEVAPGAFPFSLGGVTPLGPLRVGPVAFQTVRFRMDGGRLVAEVRARCDAGEDQEVSLTVELLDEAGSLVGTLEAAGGIEEEDDATFKARARAYGNLVDRARFFALHAATKPD